MCVCDGVTGLKLKHSEAVAHRWCTDTVLYLADAQQFFRVRFAAQLVSKMTFLTSIGDSEMFQQD